MNLNLRDTRIARLRSMRSTIGTLTCACAMLSCAAPPMAVDNEGPRAFSLDSPGRTDSALLSARYAGNNNANPNCDGENVSPALAWSSAPAGTRSFVILMDDQAGRAGLGVSHWVAYGIAPALGGLAEGDASSPSTKFVGGRNTGGSELYSGACPPRGDSPHHYVLTLIATTLEPDALKSGLTKTELLSALQGRTVGAASLVLRYAH